MKYSIGGTFSPESRTALDKKFDKKSMHDA
jgi:hypothetical protein